MNLFSYSINILNAACGCCVTSVTLEGEIIFSEMTKLVIDNDQVYTMKWKICLTNKPSLLNQYRNSLTD